MGAIRVICPYCSQPARLEDSAIVYGRSYGMIWHCAPCSAWVGTHKNSPSHKPLGRLANADLRAWKMKAHAILDPYWQGGGWTRDEAYRMAADLMGVKTLHIGALDVRECQRLIEILRPEDDMEARGER